MSNATELLKPKTSQQHIKKHSSNRSVGLLKDSVNKQIHPLLLPLEVDKLRLEDINVNIESSIGDCISVSDLNYANMGAEIYNNKIEILKYSDIILKFEHFTVEEVSSIKDKSIIISTLNINNFDAEIINVIHNKKITAVSLNFIEDIDGNPVFYQLLKNKPSPNPDLSNFIYSILLSLTVSTNLKRSFQTSSSLFQGLYCFEGAITNKYIAEIAEVPFTDFLALFWN